MGLYEEIERYQPFNEQETRDRELMLRYIRSYSDYLERENLVAHFSASTWTVNKEHTKILMVYHNIYDSWSWSGGHADGIGDLASVALRELTEETGVKHASLVSRDIFSLESLTVDGHIKRGMYVPSHLHLNVTYLAEADEKDTLLVNEEENQAVKWFSFEEALTAPSEKWMVDRIYKKLVEKCRRLA